jgi:hypothetical protein
MLTDHVAVELAAVDLALDHPNGTDRDVSV